MSLFRSMLIGVASFAVTAVMILVQAPVGPA